MNQQQLQQAEHPAASPAPAGKDCPSACRIPKKLAMINDIAGYGRCSATESIPIISALRVQVCPVPTSLFSNHTGFPVHFMHDCTPYLKDYLAVWKELCFHFDGIYCGFLGSAAQIGIVKEFLADWPDVPFILDPVMGDHGKAYRTVTQEHCAKMKSLLSRAAIITPNITEACLLTGTPYRESGWSTDALCLLSRQLHAMGPDKVVITGLREGEDYINFISERSEGLSTRINRTHSAGRSWHGTGDIFASIIAADAVNGMPFSQSVEEAAAFVRACISASTRLGIPEQDGVCFENFLGPLAQGAFLPQKRTESETERRIP